MAKSTPIAPSLCPTVLRLGDFATAIQWTKVEQRMRTEHDKFRAPIPILARPGVGLAGQPAPFRDEFAPVASGRTGDMDVGPKAPVVPGGGRAVAPVDVLGDVRPEAADAIEDGGRNERRAPRPNRRKFAGMRNCPRN